MLSLVEVVKDYWKSAAISKVTAAGVVAGMLVVMAITAWQPTYRRPSSEQAWLIIAICSALGAVMMNLAAIAMRCISRLGEGFRRIALVAICAIAAVWAIVLYPDVSWAYMRADRFVEFLFLTYWAVMGTIMGGIAMVGIAQWVRAGFEK